MGGCSAPDGIDPAAQTPKAEADAVPVSFPATLQLDQDVQQRPMTRAVEVSTRLANGYKVILLKRVDTKWIVHRTEEARFVASVYPGKEYAYTGTMPGEAYSTELTPGDYRIVLIANARRGTWNDALLPGTVVADRNDPTISAPPALTYYMEQGNYENNGERCTARDVFVATADFSVQRSTSLGNDLRRVVPVQFIRRVARFRFLLKDKDTGGANIHFNTENFIYARFTARDGARFCDGIDAMGEPYYDPANPTTTMRAIVTLTARLFAYAGEQYMAATPDNSHIFGLYWFTDPAQPVDFDVTIDLIATNSGGPVFMSDGVFPCTLANNTATGLVLETDGTATFKDGIYCFGLRQAMDDTGAPEDAGVILGPNFEWNI